MKKLVLSAVALTSLGMLASCKGGSSGPQVATPLAATPATPAQPIPTATEVFHLRSECARLAEKMLEKLEKDAEGSNSTESQLSHYDPPSNRCYVEISTQTTDGHGHNVDATDTLFDGQTGEHLASVISQGKNCPAEPCKTTGTVDDVHHQRIAGFTYAQDATEYIYDTMYDKRDR